MKKIVFLILIVILLSGCAFKKNALSFDRFQEITINNEYQFTDITTNFTEKDNVIEAGMSSTSTWHIEYYHLNSKDNALKMFNYNKGLFNNTISTKNIKIENNGLNYTYYSLTTTKEFMYICQVDDTLLYAKVPVEYRKKVLNFINEIGY